MTIHALLIALHVLAAVIWVGGMFFTYIALRPAATALSLAERLPLWSAVLGKFFLWVWLAIVVLLVTGYWMFFAWNGGLEAPLYLHVMEGLGWIMFLMFGHIFFSPWRRLRASLAAGTLNEAARYLNQIRLLLGLNLALGLAVVVVATSGRYGLL